MNHTVKSTIFVIVIFAVLAVAFAAKGQAASNSWVPGSPYYQTEDHLQNKLETKFDWAMCSGIKRFGYIRGSFFNNRYRVFDCTYKLNGSYCSDVRYASIKMNAVNHWRLKVLRPGDCF